MVGLGVLSSDYRKTRTRFTERDEKAIAPQEPRGRQTGMTPNHPPRHSSSFGA
jgi:hypothetical protein